MCKEKGHVVIEKDKYFDFIDIEDVIQIVRDYVQGKRHDKEYNLVYPEKRLLSQWAERFGATWEIKNSEGLDEGYHA